MDNIQNKRISMFTQGGRDYAVDLMRCISCFMVVAGHMSAFMISWQLRDGTVNLSSQWYLLTTMDCISVSATNLFLMISGIFFLSPERGVSISKIWSKNILKLAMAYVVWSMIYAFFRIYYTNHQTFTILTFIRETISQEFHLWYIPMMLGIYVVVPLMRVFTANAERKHYLYVIGLMVGAIILNTLKIINAHFDYPGDDSISTIIDYTPTGLICQYPFYCILGYFLYTYRPRLRTRVILYILGILRIAFLVITCAESYKYSGEIVSPELLDKFTLGILAKNTALFVFVTNFFSKVNFSKIVKRVLSKLSAATLFIYLCHIVFMYVYFHEGWLLGDGCNYFLVACIYTVVTYLAGFTISLVFLQSIPWTRMRNVVLDAVWPNRTIWTGGRKKRKNEEVAQ